MYRERVQDLGITHLLYIGVSSSGGEVVTKWSMLVFKTISYFGGCVVSWVMAKKDGEILASDTLPILCVIDFRLVRQLDRAAAPDPVRPAGTEEIIFSGKPFFWLRRNPKTVEIFANI